MLTNIIVGRTPEDRERYGEQLSGYIAKHYVGSKKEAHLANPIRLDFLRPHLINIFGKRGTGKSYTLGVIAEELASQKDFLVLLVDTMGIYWSMKIPNKKDKKLLAEWGIESKGYDVNIIIPESLESSYIESKQDYNTTFSIPVYEISADEWCFVLGFSKNSLEALIINKAIDEIDRRYYDIDDIIEQVDGLFPNDEKALIVKTKFEMAKSWGIFSNKTKSIRELLVQGKLNILDISQLELSTGESSVRELIVAIISRKILMYRIKSRKMEEMEKVYGSGIIKESNDYLPMVWLLIDEAHQYLPNKGETSSLLPLLQIIKIGREPGVSLVLATQMPFKLHQEAISQADLIISHRLTAKRDIVALSDIMQTYQKYDLADYFDIMPREKGSALILDDNSERIYEARIRPRKSWHAGESAIALREE